MPMQMFVNGRPVILPTDSNGNPQMPFGPGAVPPFSQFTQFTNAQSNPSPQSAQSPVQPPLDPVFGPTRFDPKDAIDAEFSYVDPEVSDKSDGVKSSGAS